MGIFYAEPILNSSNDRRAAWFLPSQLIGSNDLSPGAFSPALVDHVESDLHEIAEQTGVSAMTV